MITTTPPTLVTASRHDIIGRTLLLTACAERFAVQLAASRLPEPEAVDKVLRLPAAAIAVPPGTGQPFVLAEHLAAHGGQVDEDDLAAELAAAWTGHDTAQGAGSVLADVRAGRPWSQTAPMLYGGQGSFGNGAALRAIAAGLVPKAGIGAVAATARRAAAVTHTHPLALDGAAAVAVAVALSAYGQPSRHLDAGKFLDIVAGQLRCPELRSCLNIVRALLRHRAGPAEVVGTVGNADTALRTVPAALTAYLRHPEQPDAALAFALQLAGPNRAIPMITAALAGARSPQLLTPRSWRTPGDDERARRAARALSAAYRC
ncbi:ADP-ribosylglycohydrolase family protein [Catellatospora sichuanensis]|uniref:ADP-ribosylglycohydrolase family protein n=1 Tax=Catellatospora sichuanensis TaxID=1969805 RepID=UPI001642A2EE|nr:ADP-ribosylglycohydrolase family protein [Catellatospora sichuanensis]